MHPDDLEVFPELLKRYDTLQAGDLLETEFRLRDAQETWRWLLSRDTLLSSLPDGTPHLIVGYLQDISERKANEQALREAQTHLESRVQERTKELVAFAYSVSHDLRAPLRAISGFTEILLRRYRDALDAQGQHYLDNIVEASQYMDELIQDLLAYSRLGRTAFEPRPVALEAVFRHVGHALEERLRQQEAQLTWPSAPPMVLGHPTLLRQLFSNLLENALTYHKPGTSPVIEVTAQGQGRTALIHVRDRGIGIAAEHHEKIFNVFQRLHSQDAYPGTGIGLALVKKAATLMDGTVGLTSTLGEGCTFHIRLPLASEA